MPFTGPNAALNILKFIGLKATADSAGLVGFEDVLTLTSRMITVELNGGTVLVPLAAAATIDWGISFPGTTPGLAVQTGDPANPVVLDYRGTPLVGIAAEHVVLDIGEFVHVSGAFSFRMGEVETVDVNTGLLDPTVPPLQLAGLTNVTDTDDGTLGRTDGLLDDLEPAGVDDQGRRRGCQRLHRPQPGAVRHRHRRLTACSISTSSATTPRASSSRTSTSAWCSRARCRSPARTRR